MLIKYLPYFPHHWGEECGEKIHTDGENLPTLKQVIIKLHCLSEIRAEKI